MKEIIRIILLIINIASFIIIVIIGITELLGPAKFDDFLSSLNIPLNFDILWKLSIIFIPVLIITYILRKKFLDD